MAQKDDQPISKVTKEIRTRVKQKITSPSVDLELLEQRGPTSLNADESMYDGEPEEDDEDEGEEEDDGQGEEAQSTIDEAKNAIANAADAIKRGKNEKATDQAKATLATAKGRLEDAENALQNEAFDEAIEKAKEAIKEAREAERQAGEDPENEDEKDKKEKEEKDKDKDGEEKPKEETQPKQEGQSGNKLTEGGEKAGEQTAKKAAQEGAKQATKKVAEEGAKQVAEQTGRAALQAGAQLGAEGAVVAGEAAAVTTPVWVPIALGVLAVVVGIALIIGIVTLLGYVFGVDRSHLGSRDANPPAHILQDESVLTLLALLNDAKAKSELNEIILNKINTALEKVKKYIETGNLTADKKAKAEAQYQKAQDAVTALIKRFNDERDVAAQQDKQNQDKKGNGGKYKNSRGMSLLLKQDLDTAIKEIQALFKILSVVDCNNLGERNPTTGFVQMPESPSLYRIKNPSVAWGQPRFICALYHIIADWKNGHPESEVVITEIDLPTGGLRGLSHLLGQDADVYFEGATPNGNSNISTVLPMNPDDPSPLPPRECAGHEPAYQESQAKDLARIIDKYRYATTYVSLNEPNLHAAFSWIDETAPGHCDHWHIGFRVYYPPTTPIQVVIDAYRAEKAMEALERVPGGYQRR